MSRTRSNKPLTCALLGALFLALMVGPVATPAQPEGVLEQAYQRVLDAGSYSLTADVEQTLIPRPLPGMIGQTDQRVDMRIEGDVTLPDYARLQFRMEGADFGAPPVALIQDGGETFLISDGAKMPVENPAGLSAPAGDYLSYLAAAENVQPCDPADLPFAGWQCYTYDVNGPHFAEHVRDHMQTELESGEQPLPLGAELSPSPLLQRTTGHGKVWVDANGLPRRQVLDLEMPEVSDEYDAQVHMVVDLVFDEEAIQQLGQSENRPIFGGIKVHIAPADLGCLLLSLALATVLIALRRRRWVYGIVATSVSIIVVVTPVLQAAGVVRFQERQAQAAESIQPIAEALGLSTSPAESPRLATRNSQLATRNTLAHPDLYCGAGDPNQDTDDDGLNDAAENCLGTSPYQVDSDYDQITDTLEIDGFTFGGRIWTSDAVNPDSNRDGLVDTAEWPEPVGSAPEWDPDGDGVPNLWDDDNDGDGVPDSRDVSPFSRTDYGDDFSFNLHGGFDGHLYIEIQVQPEDDDHLRYTTTLLDWPHDEEGHIRDLNDSTDDLRLIPMLEVLTNQTPQQELRSKYDVLVFTDTDDAAYPYRMYLPLSWVGDSSRIVAFQTRLAYGPDALADADVRWKEARIVWMAQFENDTETYGRVVVETTPIHTYAEPSFRVTGLQVTKSRNFQSAILGIPNAPHDNDDRQMFNLLFGLSSTFLTHQEPTLQEINTRFTSGGTDPVKKWGVTADVAVDLPISASEHRDKGMAALGARVRQFLNDNYNTDSHPSLIVAFQEETGSYSLDDLDPLQFEADAAFDVNLAQIDLLTQRGLRLNMYEHGSNWNALEDSERLEIVERRYHDLSATLDGLHADYPDLTESDLRALTELFYLTWDGGRTRMAAINSQFIAPEARSDLAVYDKLYLPEGRFDALPAYLVEAGDFARDGGGLNFTGGQGQAWQYLQANEQTADDLGFTFGGARIFDELEDAFSSVLEAIGNIGDSDFYLETLKSFVTSDELAIAKQVVLTAGAVKDAANAIRGLGRLSDLGGFSVSKLAVALLVIDLGLTWGAFFAAGDYSPQAISMAIAATIFSVALFIISCNPIGAVLVAIFVVVDLILSLCGGPSLSGEAVKAVAWCFYGVSVDLLTKIGSYEFIKGDSGLVHPEMSLIKGNRFRLSDEFRGTIEQTSTGGGGITGAFLSGELSSSYIYGEYEGQASEAIVTNKNTRRSCSTSGDTKTCRNDVQVEYALTTARHNVELRFKSIVHAKTYYEKCQRYLFITVCRHKSQYTDNEGDFETFYLDVLPDNVGDLWGWSDLTNPDMDGDGLSNDQEDGLGSGKNDWDSDDDGLSDGFEFEQQGTLGTDPLQYDTDGDGLSDGFEYHIGTRIDRKDSDQDGLEDGEEVYHQENGAWVGGWDIPLPNKGGTVRVFSDPLNGDADNDGLNDYSEKAGSSSPHAYNEAPRLTLETSPLDVSPTGEAGIYVEPGDTVVLTMTLEAFPPYGINSTLELCLPDFLTDIQGGDLSGDRTPARRTNYCGLQWSFTRDGDMLKFFETVSTTVTAVVRSGLSGSASGKVYARVPYGDDEEQMVLIPAAADVDDPQVTIVSPSAGELIGGDVEHYVIGGSSSDPTTWVDHVEVDLPVAGTATITESLSPWAYTWELPADGVYNLTARAYDFVGRVSSADVVQVTVDNTPAIVTLDLEDGAFVTGQSGDVITVTLSGSASDNLSGLARVQISTDGKPWREVWAEDGAPLTAAWSSVWELPNEESAQGEHVVKVRAFDRANNEPDVLERTIVVDVVPPTDELTNRAYLYDWPHVEANENLLLYGVANDAGNVPAPSRPAELAGTLNGIEDATVRLGLSSSDENDGGVSVAWMGDFNGDRLADLAVGLPSVADGDGRVTVVYGRAGGWPVPPDLELLSESALPGDGVTSFVGQPGAGIGDSLAAAGDVNGDGYDDLLVGDTTNHRLYVIFGRPNTPGSNLLLDGPRAAMRSEITVPDGEQIGEWLGAAGDVNGDGFDDLLVGATGAEGKTYLLLGQAAPWWDTVELDVHAAVTITTGAAGARLSGVGDMDGDHYDEFVVAEGNAVYLFEGQDAFIPMTGEELLLGDAIDTFTSADARPQVAALGDVNGDDLADFAYTDGDTPHIVFGDDNLGDDTWSTHDFSFTPAPSGFLVAPGDVDSDGLNDVLIGNADDNAILILGSDLDTIQATLTGVETAASAPYAAGADLNSDGSSDLLLVPTEAATEHAGFEPPRGYALYINPAWLPHASRYLSSPSSPNALSAMLANLYVDDDGNCDGQAPCYSSIQAAVTAAIAGDIIGVHPGVYSSFVVDGKNDLTIVGVHPDAVFVDGGGGSHVAQIQSAAGVRLENLTLRNGTYGVHLEDAGNPADKTVLDTLFVYDFASHAVYLNHTSVVSLTQCTLVGEGDHIEVYGAPPTFDAAWSTASTDSRAATEAGGGLIAAGGDLYVLPGGGSGALYRYDGGWTDLNPAARGFGPGSAAADGSDGQLYALRGGLLGGGVNGPVYAVAVAPNGDVYVGGDFSQVTNPDGTSASVNNIARWDGSQWGDVGQGVVNDGFGGARLAQVNAITIDGSNVYVGGRFTRAGGSGGITVLNIARWNGSNWSALDTGVDVGSCGSPKDPALCDVFVADIAVSGGDVYVGGAFSSAGSARTGPVARYSGGSWSALGDYRWDGPVRAIVALGSSDVYVGGNFTQAGGNAANRVAHWNGSSWSALGSSLNNVVHAMAVSGSNVYVGGAFTQAGGGAADHVARWNGSSWSALNTGLDGPALAMVLNGNDLYVGGSFTHAGGSTARYLAHWDTLSWNWSAVGMGASAEVGAAQPLAVHALTVFDDETYAGGEFVQNVARGESRSYRYSIGANSWSEFSPPSQTLGSSAALIGDGSGQRLYALVGRDFYSYTISSDTWGALASLPHSIGAGGVLAWAGDSVYALRGGGNADIYRYDPAMDHWFTLAAAPYPFDVGAALERDGRDWLYALHGGNGQQFTRYHIPTDQWQILGDGNTGTPGDDDTAEGVQAGGGVAFIESDGAMYAVPGGGAAQLWSYDPVADYPEKLTMDRVLFVAPEMSTDVTWINLAVPPDDFYFTSNDSAWVGGSNTVFSPTVYLKYWSPPPLYLDGSDQTTYGPASFLDVLHDLYRVDENSTLNAGYHTYRQKARVAPSGKEFTSIQEAINSGANYVVVETGLYEEPFYLVSGVEVVGNSADLVIIEPPATPNVPAVARAEGVVDASLSRVTLNGDDEGVNGLQVEDGALVVAFSRSIVRGAGTGILVDGPDTDLEVFNNTVVQNVDGMNATNCGPVDVRNTIFAYHSGAGLTYQECASTQLHTYNLFWANGDDFGGEAEAGASEIFLDPLFVNLQAHDYHTLDESPVINAGNPTDPAPPGAGNRVDIGYVEQSRTGYYVDDDYCEVCPNDGLVWQVSAFDSIQDGLDAAADDLEALMDPGEAMMVSVGVGPGTYTETVVVPSHVQLAGSGAEDTIIDVEGGGTPITFDGVAQAGVSGFTITGADSPGVAVTGASNHITITRNIIRDNFTAIAFSDRATGWVTFNTIVNNTGPGVTSNDAGTWTSVENNILSSNGVGLIASSDGQIFGNYNLLTNTVDYDGVTQGGYDVVGQDPQFQSETYRLTVGSPALDAASLTAGVPAGGGERADLGYRELLAAPILLFLGKEDVSTAVGNSGVSEVEYGVTLVADPSQPVTETLPSQWNAVGLDSPGETVSYWETNYLPGDEGLYRFYSRATDEIGNQEDDKEDWYDGAFVADSTPPDVTWLSPPNGANVDTPLELRAEVSDYAAGQFSAIGVRFVLDGETYEAEWAAEPWDEEGEEPRVFRAWISTTVSSHTAYAVAEDKAGNEDQSSTVTFDVTASSPADTVSPTLVVVSPAEGTWVTHTVVFAGTADDVGSGLASVEVSVDGGYLWLPATVDGGGFHLAWDGPEKQDAVSFPARVRASDRAGNVITTTRLFTLDEAVPTGLSPVTFSAPEGTHFDIAPTLTITWNTPVDGSGIATTLLAVDQVSETVPSVPVAGISATRELDASGDWYVHVGAQDAAGNKSTNHYGPWHVGLTDEGIDFGNRQQSIVIDGYLDVENGEWRTDIEFLDDDERPEDAPSFYKPREGQSFYTTWDGEDFYMAWQGAWWDMDGTLWIYLDVEAGGSSQLISSSPDTELPFDADYAVEITSPATGMLWHYNSGWQPSAEEWEFAQGQSGGTEIRLPLLGTAEVKVLAFALGDNDRVYAIFPTANALNPAVEELPMTRAAVSRLAARGVRVTSLTAASSWVSYSWPDITVVTSPSAGQPKTTGVKLVLDSPQAPAAPWGPGSTLEYLVKLENLESYTITDLLLSFTAIPAAALAFQSVDGADCVTCMGSSPWWFEMDLPTGTTFITITGKLTGDVSGIAAVTPIVALENISTTPGIPCQASVSHQVDGQPPTVTVEPLRFARHGPRTVYGTADDGDGIGVATVEMRPEGGSWQVVTGTLNWTADVIVPGSKQHGETWQLAVQAKDEYSQTSAVETVAFTVDLEPPTLALDLPQTIGGGYAEVIGTVIDSPTESRAISVEVKSDCGAAVTPTPTWRSALVYEPNEDGVQDWLWLWSLPQGLEEGHVCTLTARTADLVGNVSYNTSGPQQIMVDTIAPQITTTKLITTMLEPTQVLTGTLSDGIMSGTTVVVHVNTPLGNFYSEETDYSEEEGRYAYTLDPGEERGDFIVYVEGRDMAGNSVRQGPFPFSVPCVYLPLMANNYIVAPDLVVENVTATSNDVQVTISNQGNAPVVDGFWVEGYVNPSPAPTAVNQLWWELGDEGMFWVVPESALPLNPGETITLAVSDDYYATDYSRVSWPLAVGTVVYVQADAWNADTDYGAIREIHEVTGDSYGNNIGSDAIP